MTAPVQPYDWQQAFEADRVASDRQRAAEQFIIDCARKHAEARRAYREALASEIVKLRAEGTAATVAGTMARGVPRIAALKYAEDVADGMREAASQGAWRASKDRDAELKRVEWSMRRDLSDAYRPPEGPADPVTYGKRAS